MARIDLQKGSEEFELFRDYWKLFQEHWGVEGDDAYWKKVTEDSHAFYEKYKTPFAKELTLTYMNELERRWKNENQDAGRK